MTKFTLLLIGLALTISIHAFPQAVDLTFQSHLGTEDIVYSLDLLDDGRIMVGGAINAAGSDTSRPRGIARLNPDGSLDNSFNAGTGFNDLVWKLAVQDDGKTLVGARTSILAGRCMSSI